MRSSLIRMILTVLSCQFFWTFACSGGGERQSLMPQADPAGADLLLPWTYPDVSEETKPDTADESDLAVADTAAGVDVVAPDTLPQDSIAGCDGPGCGDACAPSCEPLACGLNGCGGLCSVCQPGTFCESSACKTLVTCKQVLDCALACPQGGCGCEDAAAYTALTVYNKLWQCVVEYADLNGLTPYVAFDAAVDVPCIYQHQSCLGACTKACLSPSGSRNECGPDGCGGSCGSCGQYETCLDGNCFPVA